MEETKKQSADMLIFKDHKKDLNSVVGKIGFNSTGMLIKFNKGFEPTHEKMGELFGCAAGHIMKETEDGRIKEFWVKSWGYL